MVDLNAQYYHPYKDKGNIRTFLPNVDQEQLVWHRDREDRIIEVIKNTDWQFQFDNELPQPLKTDLFIPKGVYHRLIKGSGILKITIKKL